MFNKKSKKLQKTIEESGLFDKVFYLKTYRDARLADMLPLEHYVTIGIKEDRKPNATFDPVWYRAYYKDVKEDGGYPLVHFIKFGEKEGRFQNEDEKNLHTKKMKAIELFFLEKSYLAANLDVKEAIENKKITSAFEHFTETGFREVLKGERRLGLEFPYFTEEDYKNTNIDIQTASINDKNYSISEHICNNGYAEFLKKVRIFGGHYPFELNDTLMEKIKNIFDEDDYLAINTDVAKAVDEKIFQNGWEHFVKFGMEEIRKGQRQMSPKVPLLSEHEYVQKNEDLFNALKEGLITSPFEHFLLHGVLEYADGSRVFNSASEVKYIYNEPIVDETIKKELESFKKKPLISVVMPVYNVDAQWLEYAVDSLNKQWYENWELCITDDKSTKKETVEYLKTLNNSKVKIKFLEKNLNISGASNEALSMATGEYLALMDNDDELTPDAFYEVIKAINEQDAEFIYSDEDKLEMDGTFSDPHFKPDFAPDMFLSQNYLSHLGVIKKELIDKVGGWEIGLEGAQDYDLYLKILEHTDKIVHIDKVLYHWRKIPGSTASEFSDKSYAQEAGRKALQNTLNRRGIEAKAIDGVYPGTYKVEYEIKDNPLVSIVIPFKDKPELLDMCIYSILKKSTYQNYEIIGISNNSQESETFMMMQKLEEEDARVKFYEYNVPFNYSDINNYAVNHFAKGEHILLLNNDIEIISTRWIEEMLMHSQRPDVGCVGAKLYYPDDTLQHAGVAIGVLTLAGHNFKHLPKGVPGYMGRESVIQNISAVTAACLMVKQSIYNQVNGLNEENLKIAFNDVDFCLRVQEKGYFNIFTPYAEAYHHESISRGAEDNPEKVARFNSEVKYMQERHTVLLQKGDPFYNKNLTLDREDFSLKGN